MDDSILQHYKVLFLKWAAKKWSGCDEDTRLDVFYDSLAVWLKYDRQNKITVEPITFLISVGNRIFAKRYQSGFAELKIDLPDGVETDEGQKELVRKGLKKLDSKCREILIAKYYYNFSMEEIREEIGSSSAATVRTQKKRCMRKLKTILEELRQVA